MVLKFLGPLCYKKINEDPGQELDPTCHNLRVCIARTKELTCLNDQRFRMPTSKTITTKTKQMQPNKEFKIN